VSQSSLNLTRHVANQKKGHAYLAILAVAKLDEHKGLNFHSFDGYAAPIIRILEGGTDQASLPQKRGLCMHRLQVGYEVPCVYSL